MTADLTDERRDAWSLWDVIRRTGRTGVHVKPALELLADPLPEPEVRARPPREGEVPRSAMALYRLGEEHGWYGSITYARGPVTHGRTGKVLRMADSICVRLARQVDSRTMQRVVAAWVDGGFDVALAWGAGEPPTALAGTGPNSVANYLRTPPR